MHFLYVLKGSKNPKFYIGYTSNIKERIKGHNDGDTVSMSKGRPWKLIYLEGYRAEVQARKRELTLKKYGKAWQELKKRIDDLDSA